MGNETIKNLIDPFGDDIYFQIEPCKLYEVVVIIKWPHLHKFNTSAMGVRFDSEGRIYLRPYPDTDTFDLLSNPEVEILTLNFTDDVESFAIAALSGLHAGSEVEELDHSALIIEKDHALLKNAQIVIVGKILCRNQPKSLRYNSSSFDELNLTTSEFLSTFQLETVKVTQTSVKPQPVNRGDNLALEAIVYTSKIPAFQKQNNSYRTINELVEKVRTLQYDIRRFSASKRALTVCNIIDNFLDKILKLPY